MTALSGPEPGRALVTDAARGAGAAGHAAIRVLERSFGTAGLHLTGQPTRPLGFQVNEDDDYRRYVTTQTPVQHSVARAT